MTAWFDLEKGIAIVSPDGIIIRDDAALWDMEPLAMAAALREARRLKPLADLTEWIRIAEGGRWLLELYPNLLPLLQSIDENPFAEEEDRVAAREILAIHNAQRRRRAPRTSLRARVITRDRSRCRYCGIETANPEIDHVVPYSLGGRTDINNLVVSCEACNARKSDRSLEESGMPLLDIP